MKHEVALLVSIVSVLAFSQTSRAGFTFTGSDGSGHSASVTFDIVGGNLVATLTNTGIATSDPTDVLTGMFFNTSNSQLSTLDATSVTMTDGSARYVNSSGNVITQQNPGTDVGGEWASGANPAGFTYGVAAAGFDPHLGRALWWAETYCKITSTIRPTLLQPVRFRMASLAASSTVSAVRMVASRHGRSCRIL